MSVYYMCSLDELSHYGVKGMKWGVRKQIQRNMQAQGYRRASIYTQKRDIRTLKKNRHSSGMTNKEYRKARSQIKSKAMVDRGKQLVAANQTYKRTLIKGLGKSAAVALGSSAIAGMAVGVGLPSVAGMTAAAGGAYLIRNTVNTGNKMREIRAYRKR